MIIAKSFAVKFAPIAVTAYAAAQAAVTTHSPVMSWFLENIAVILTIVGAILGYGELKTTVRTLREESVQHRAQIDKIKESAVASADFSRLERLIEGVIERKATRAEVAEHHSVVLAQISQMNAAIAQVGSRLDGLNQRIDKVILRESGS